MWPHYKADGSKELAMDYSSGDIAQLFDLTLERRYNGNRAPIGIFLHAGWLQINGPALKSWIESTLSQYSDVHFVTNYELIEWMRNPVPGSEYESSCEGQVIGCLPASAQMCVFGTFNAETCECDSAVLHTVPTRLEPAPKLLIVELLPRLLLLLTTSVTMGRFNLTTGTSMGLAVTAFRLEPETVSFLRVPMLTPLATVLHGSQRGVQPMSVPTLSSTLSGATKSVSQMVNNESGIPASCGTHWSDAV
jgi:hypothetical protein